MGNTDLSVSVPSHFIIGHTYSPMLDQAEFHTYSKMGLYMNLGAQPDHALPSQAKDLIDTEDNIYVRCYL